MIDLRQLRAFVVVTEEGNVTRAAARLHMQQPPLTRLLHRLEADLGAQLLHRTTRGVRVTEAGLALQTQAQRVLDAAQALPEAVRRAASGEQGRLALGFTSSAALHPFVSSALREFREGFPKVTIALEEAGTGALVDALLAERLDAAFVRSSVGSVPDLLVEAVLDEPMVAALPAGHPLDRPGPLPLSALAREPFVLYRRWTGPGLYDTILAACHAAGFNPEITQEAPRLTATLSLVAAGLGVSIVPAFMQMVGGYGIAFRELIDCPGLSAPLQMARRKGASAPSLARFREIVSRKQGS